MAKRPAALVGAPPVLPQQWPADKVVRRRVAELIAYPRNARRHPDEQIALIMKLIQRFGWTTPCLIDETGMILAGHGRVMAANRLGYGTVPCIVVEGLSDDDKRALMLADNKAPEGATWDNVLLRGELTALQLTGYDLSLTGFAKVDLVSFLAVDTGKSGGLGSLVEQFGIPPFSVFSARMGYWQDRKRAWLALGIQSEIGRGDPVKTTGGGSVMPAADHGAGGARNMNPRKGRAARAQSFNSNERLAALQKTGDSRVGEG